MFSIVYRMVKEMTLGKIKFYKNDDENGGALMEAINNKKDNEIIIHSQTKKNGRLWGSVVPLLLLKLIEKNRGLYEVINTYPHKVYFDIDKEGKQDGTFLTIVKNIIVKYFPNADMAISGSVKETKTSYHIILQNYTIHNDDEREIIKHIAKHICLNEEESFDWKVYTHNRNMKCINQSKDDGRVQEIIENNDFKAHCITCFISDYCLPFPKLIEEIEDDILISKSTKAFDLGTLPKYNLKTPEDFDAPSATPNDMLGLLPLDDSFDFYYKHLIARFCYYNELSFETFLSWLQKQNSNPLTHEKINKWNNHWQKLTKFPPVQSAKILGILQYYYPNIKKDIHFRYFNDTFILPQNNIAKIETISQPNFYSDKKYEIFNIGMGGGKTAQTIKYLQMKENFVWIAPNKALATNTKKRFDDEHITVDIYDKIKASDKKNGLLQEKQKLIVCLNSIHYLGKKNYDVLVIDEIETLIDKFLGDFLEQGKALLKDDVWRTFLNLFRNAKKVILLDAFITKKTLKLVELIEGDLSNINIYERENEPQTRTIKFMDTYTDKDYNKFESYEVMIADIINKLNDGLKLFIFYPYKFNCIRYPSMEQLFSSLIEKTGKKGIFYNADVDDKTKKGLKDVNNSWENVDFVITNNIITCGINYENLDFDYKYIFIAKHNSPRDIIQVSYRARHLNTGIIKVCYLGKMQQNTTWENDCERMNCKIYTEMYKTILIEKKAPMKKAFQLFCNKAHYKQITDDFKINKVIEEEIEELLKKNSICKSYDSISNITTDLAQIIEEKCFAQQATMDEKYSLNKYYFKRSFDESKQDDKIIGKIWDNKYVFLVKKLGSVFTYKKNLFNQIAEYNKLPIIFPQNINKMKFDNDIKNRIFKEFTFKYINQNTNVEKIVKEIYNTYFGNHIILVETDGNHNATYKIEDDKYEELYKIYNFCKSYLLLSNSYLSYEEYWEEMDCKNDCSIEI